MLCVAGSLTIVLHAPEERPIISMLQVWQLALQPGQLSALPDVVAVCVVTQMNYLNKALDLFNTAIVSPIYYVMFTTFTITASIILFQEVQSPRQATTEVCGFVTIVIGTFLLHSTKDLDITLAGLNAATKSTFSAANLSELQMQRLPLTSNGALDSPAPIGHRMTNSDRF
ncbi:TPA: hypothetical protein ACH3X3_012297 [Trebouxia sp. C0006]